MALSQEESLILSLTSLRTLIHGYMQTRGHLISTSTLESSGKKSQGQSHISSLGQQNPYNFLYFKQRVESQNKNNHSFKYKYAKNWQEYPQDIFNYEFYSFICSSMNVLIFKKKCPHKTIVFLTGDFQVRNGIQQRILNSDKYIAHNFKRADQK